MKLSVVCLGFALITGCAVHTQTAAGEPSVVQPPPPTTATRPPPSELQTFKENLEHAKVDAEKAGWLVKEVVLIPERHAALVIYEPAPASAPATRVARVDAVGAGPYQVVSTESGLIDVMKTRRGSLLWDLRGDGSKSVVIHLTPCGANCGVARPLVLELTKADSFQAAKAHPECPTCMRDEDADGVPEFEVRLAQLSIAPCSRVSCGPAGALLVDVRGVERWDGQKFARDLKLFAPLYRERFKLAERDAERVKRATERQKTCPLNVLGVAARVYVYSRLTGNSGGDALKTADRLMRGWDTRPCAKEFDLLAPPKGWNELSKELEAVVLPRLEAPAAGSSPTSD
ncbi:MAG: hypothetical protein IPI67_05105 [Myxococcales bacterium]|nr:hypothetical protein [Myxococcales bacterium]